MGFFIMLDGSVAILRIGTLLLITFLGISSQSFILVPALATLPLAQQVRHLGPFNVAIVLIYWTFYLACQDPGAVRSNYVPPEGQETRYCKKCKAFKPPRTHHCKSCGRCVLKMDHHCPWLSGCVGYFNHAAFIKFMLCVVPTTGYLAWQMAVYLWAVYYGEASISSRTMEVIMGLLNFIGAISVCFMVSVLLLYQLWCLSENITTIESWSKKRTEELVRKRKIPAVEFPYDLYSFSENIREVFGHHSVFILLWPTLRATGDGHAFPVNEDADVSQPWPPKDPTAVPQDELGPATKDNKKQKKNRTGAAAMRSESMREMEEDADDLSYDDYARLGLIGDSEESDDDYVNGDGEDLGSYGVDDDDEVTDLTEAAGEDDLTLAQLLNRRRSEARMRKTQ